MQKSEQFARNHLKLGIFFTFVLLEERGGATGQQGRIYGHLATGIPFEIRRFSFFFSRCNPKWNPSPFFCNSSRMESQGNPKRFFWNPFNNYWNLIRASLYFLESYVYCVFQMGLGNRYLRRQKLVHLLVSSSLWNLTFLHYRLNTDVYRYLFLNKYNIFV